jgi:hypothetical protein
VAVLILQTVATAYSAPSHQQVAVLVADQAQQVTTVVLVAVQAHRVGLVVVVRVLVQPIKVSVAVRVQALHMVAVVVAVVLGQLVLTLVQVLMVRTVAQV